jgi:hypothetical protein
MGRCARRTTAIRFSRDSPLSSNKGRGDQDRSHPGSRQDARKKAHKLRLNSADAGRVGSSGATARPQPQPYTYAQIMKAAHQEPCQEVVERLEAILLELERLPLPASKVGRLGLTLTVIRRHRRRQSVRLFQRPNGQKDPRQAWGA